MSGPASEAGEKSEQITEVSLTKISTCAIIEIIGVVYFKNGGENMEKNRQPRKIKFNRFSLLNFSFGLNVLFIFEKLGWVTFKSAPALFLTAIIIFFLMASYDLLLAFFRQKNPTKLQSKHTKHCGWGDDASWGFLTSFYTIVTIFIFYVVAIIKLDWIRIPDNQQHFDFVLIVLPLCIAFRQYWYFYNDFTPNQEQSPK